MADDFKPWSELDRELEVPVADGGGMFCGVTEEQFAINGTTYQWPRGSKLSWNIGFSRLGALSDMDVKDVFAKALKEISDCCDVTHGMTANHAAANIRVISQRLDGASGVLADCEIPVGNVTPDNKSLRMRLDDSENWVLADNPAPGTIDLYRVVLHELLHGHGLGHKPASLQVPALIAPVYTPLIKHLQKADVDELVRRYGTPRLPPLPPAPPTGGPPIGDSVGVEIIIKTATAQYKAAGTAKRA